MSSINSISLTLISDKINFLTFKTDFFSDSDKIVTRILFNGCLTLILSFFLKDKAREEIILAFFMLFSKFKFLNFVFGLGK